MKSYIGYVHDVTVQTTHHQIVSTFDCILFPVGPEIILLVLCIIEIFYYIMVGPQGLHISYYYYRYNYFVGSNSQHYDFTTQIACDIIKTISLYLYTFICNKFLLVRPKGPYNIIIYILCLM